MKKKNTVKPVIGIDIGKSTIKLVQLDQLSGNDIVKAYGFTKFKPSAISDGEIVDFEEVAKNLHNLIENKTIGEMDSKRVSTSVPISSTYIRVLNIAKTNKKDLASAVRIEAEQYIPTVLDDLYIDFEIIGETNTDYEVLVVAAPKKIVDSYLRLFDLMGLESYSVETSMNSVARIIKHSDKISGDGTIAIDIGPTNSDIAIIDKTIRVTGSAKVGGNDVTKAIAEGFNITPKQAEKIKKTSGLNPGDKQKQIIKSVEPVLENLTREVQRMVRFYANQTKGKKKIDEIILLGGSSNMPGLSTYFTDKLRIPTRLCNPWQNLSFEELQPPHKNDMGVYATASGLALLSIAEGSA